MKAFAVLGLWRINKFDVNANSFWITFKLEKNFEPEVFFTTFTFI